MTKLDVLSTEHSIVSNLMRNPNLLSKLKLKPEMFTDINAQKFIQHVLDKGKVDVNEIYYKSREDVEFIPTQVLTKLFNSNGTDKTYFMQDQMNILNEYILNQARSETNNFQSSPSKESFKYLIEQLKELDTLTIEKDNPTDTFLTSVMENILSDKPKTFITTSFKRLDEKIHGFEEGQLNVLAGRPSTGKTALALNIVWNLAKEGYPTTFFSLETGGNNIVERLTSAISNVPLYKIKKSDGLSDDEVDRVMAAINSIKQHSHFRIEDHAQITPQDVREIAMRQSDKPHVICIDYLQLMKSDLPQKDRRLEVEKISRDLKIIAKETGCLIIALSQLSRGVESRQDKRPMMSDLREAGGIEQDANMIFMLYRDDYYNRELADDDTGKSDIELNVAKNKDGETGVVELQFFKKTQRFY
ncbi:DnaB helicase C-terminal domain-containing protein [Staphylococcus hominis]|uniref:DnaB helicase C-terminal domain-containing protein n=1 Tax=Staphylococcus hominis TaxID=1290 RepID=UPI00066CD319|nr:DnaB helicase C-terminal domain-containing protein [Staphylococcus hominis]